MCNRGQSLNYNNATTTLFHILELIYSRRHMLQNEVMNLYFNLRYREKREAAEHTDWCIQWKTKACWIF